ncbi:hypothetical protein [Dyella sp. GSA-30]|uniref:hypothetical protein n=1 Tax=Dyella sp. GSA-30 TaxID=2994496 RepID=UPI0024910E66|nr:hypothetical protein [Dyella sp. GSA-30]BDU22134.1 hypothetical protein DYGSA30_35910 [Dyella sp. GSA-30]
MNLSINTSATATVSTTNPSTTALKQSPPDPTTGPASASLTVAAVDPQKSQQAVQSYLSALFGTQAKLSADSEAIANALVPSMQRLILQRPDLANAQFDFSSDNGAIKVTSNSLSESDRTWLQNTFNQNGSLVKAVNTFHDDAVAGYAQYAQLDGHSLSRAEMDAVSTRADGMTHFMSLFKRLGAAAQPLLDGSGGTYVAQNGAKLNLVQPSTAVGFLSFMQSAKASSDGTATLYMPKGQIVHGGLKGDVFANMDAMPRLLPPSDSHSFGFHEVA